MIEIKNINDWHSLLAQAEIGDGKAQYEVATYYESGWTIDGSEIVKIDLQLAFDWTKKAYESGNIDGCERYANYLTDGTYKYCEKNIALAMQLYERAMNAGSSSAAHNLGIEYRNKQNFEEALELYLQAKDSLTIGLCYYYGIGTKKDRLKALEFFKSVEPGVDSAYDVNEANFMIGKIYLEGEVIEQSLEKARYHLELADEEWDHDAAQGILGVIGRKKMIN